MGMVLIIRRATEEQVAAIRAEPELIGDFMYEDAGPDVVDFDKAWHVLHFLVTGSNEHSGEPLSFLRPDSEPVGEGVGYGPAEYIALTAMAHFAAAWAAFSDEELKRRLWAADLKAADVYGGDFIGDEPELDWEYLHQSIPALRQLASKCAETGSGALVMIG